MYRWVTLSLSFAASALACRTYCIFVGRGFFVRVLVMEGVGAGIFIVVVRVLDVVFVVNGAIAHVALC